MSHLFRETTIRLLDLNFTRSQIHSFYVFTSCSTFLVLRKISIYCSIISLRFQIKHTMSQKSIFACNEMFVLSLSGNRPVHKLLSHKCLKSCSNFLKTLLKSCSKTLKVAQELPKEPKVASKSFFFIFWCKRLIMN